MLLPVIFVVKVGILFLWLSSFWFVRFHQDGSLIAAPESGGRLLQINDDSPVLACTLREDHYGVLSEALIIDKTRNVSYSVTNPELLRKG